MDIKAANVSISPEICDSFKNTKVVNFVQSLIKRSYAQFFPDNISEVHSMVDEAFLLLTESQNKPGLESLIEAIHQIHQKVFVKSKCEWFYKIYKNYKVNIRPKEDYKKIGQYIQGKTVLDIGAGAGYFSHEIQLNKFDVTALDVLDYRNGNATDVKFIKMNSATDLPIDGQYDIAILKTVLHHISYDNIPVLLKKIRSKVKRLIIEEDVFGLTCDDTFGIQDDDLDFFCNFSLSDQKDMLMIMDLFGNIIVYGIDEMTLPFQFKTLRDWEKVLSETGWKEINKIVIGFDKTRIHRPCQVWFVCD